MQLNFPFYCYNCLYFLVIPFIFFSHTHLHDISRGPSSKAAGVLSTQAPKLKPIYIFAILSNCSKTARKTWNFFNMALYLDSVLLGESEQVILMWWWIFGCALFFSILFLLLLLWDPPVLPVQHRHPEGGTSAVSRPLPRNPRDGRHQPGGPVLAGFQDLPWLDQLHEHHPLPPDSRCFPATVEKGIKQNNKIIYT